jgi:polyisoprenoid-binding protein YceI
VISQVSGGFRDFNGTINYDPSDATKSTVDVHIMAASVNTGNDKGDGFVAYGPLTIHGVTKDVELPFTIAGTIKDGMVKTHLVAQSSIPISTAKTMALAGIEQSKAAALSGKT